MKLPTSVGSYRKHENPRKNIYFCFIEYAKAFDSVDHNKLWKQTEHEMVGWHRWLTGHESEQRLIVKDREALNATVHGGGGMWIIQHYLATEKQQPLNNYC